MWSLTAALAALGVLIGYWEGGLAGVLSERAGSRASDGMLWGVTVAVGVGTAGTFPNGIALGRRMFPLVGAGLGPGPEAPESTHHHWCPKVPTYLPTHKASRSPARGHIHVYMCTWSPTRAHTHVVTYTYGWRLYHAAGMTQALFELGAAMGAGAGPYVAAW